MPGCPCGRSNGGSGDKSNSGSNAHIDDEQENEESGSQSVLLRTWNKIVKITQTNTYQCIAYFVFVAVFQVMLESLRMKEEYFLDKMVTDTFLENHFDGSHNSFETIRRVPDIWECVCPPIKKPEVVRARVCPCHQ